MQQSVQLSTWCEKNQATSSPNASRAESLHHLGPKCHVYSYRLRPFLAACRKDIVYLWVAVALLV